jgi:protein tyrosine phosphatase (PTP) superfamily phosphohydrolase (DUF442 family)
VNSLEVLAMDNIGTARERRGPRLRRWLLAGIAFAVAALAAWYLWWNYFECRLQALVPGKVYRSAAIPPARLPGMLKRLGIRTVVDFRNPTAYTALNPVTRADVDAEAAAIAGLPGIRYVNIPSDQVPDRRSLQAFFDVMDDSSAHPVLMHCYHGTGRAVLYGCIYLIEYEGVSNEDARRGARLFVELPFFRSSFARGRPKGEFVAGYRPRSLGASSTLKSLP